MTWGVKWLISPVSKNVLIPGYVMRIAVGSMDIAVKRTDQSCPLRVNLLETEASKLKVIK